MAMSYPQGVQALEALLSTQGVGVVNHGSDPDVERPVEHASYLWLGTVHPVNMDEDEDIEVIVT